MEQKSQPTPIKSRSQPATEHLPTFLEHLHELRRRLFWVAAVVILASTAAYPFVQMIVDVLVHPLGGQKLFYLTPISGFSFIIKICTYVGVLVGIPFILYHLYRFIEPLVSNARLAIARYVMASTLLAIAGILFAYFVSLPAALHFLTGFNIQQIEAMLTVDSYLTFVMTYLLGAAILFQIPLILSIINRIHRLPPRKLMGFQRYVILAAFVLAAIISPTPDMVNQAFLAVPIIVMYQIGVLGVWLQQRKKPRPQRIQQVIQRSDESPIPNDVMQELTADKPVPTPSRTVVVEPVQIKPLVQPTPKPQPIQKQMMDIITPGARQLVVPKRQTTPKLPPRHTMVRRPNISPPMPRRSIDGFFSLGAT
ncbi:MAG: twin-arginine translocase subunit TatC [Candidatus Saccharimonadales bacterium]